jgi:hypothetical protein
MNNQIDYILNGNRKMTKGNNMKQKDYLKKTNVYSTDRFMDADKDGVPNGGDCYPYNRKRHNGWVGLVYADGVLAYRSQRALPTPNAAQADAVNAKQALMIQDNTKNYSTSIEGA